MFTSLYGFETTATRYFNVFGPRQDPGSPYSGVISLFATALLEGRWPTIYGDGEQTRDFTYVANVVDGVLRACTAPAAAGETVDIATGARISLNELLRVMNRSVGTNLEPIYKDARQGDVMNSQADITKAKTLLDYSPVVVPRRRTAEDTRVVPQRKSRIRVILLRPVPGLYTPGMMLRTGLVRIAAFLLATLVVAAPTANAEVTRVEVITRAAVGTSGYEKIIGIVHFAVDPKDPRNRVIADIDKAPVNTEGKVEFSADLYIMRPLDAAKSNGVALVDVVNRGRKTTMRFSRVASTVDSTDAASPCPTAAAAARAQNAAAADADPNLGDGFLTDRGMTLVWVGWEADIRRRAGVMGVDLPKAKGVTGMVSAVFTPCDRRPNQTVADLLAYAAVDPNAPDTTLTVRDEVFGPPEVVARSRWSIERNVVSMPGGFEPGRMYEISYRAADPPISGLGLAGFRDVTSWIKHAPDALAKARYAYAFGSSQSGRFLRAFLYDGFNTDEHGVQVYDAVMAHIAGAARLDVNKRFGTPNALAMFTGTTFPFAATSQRDPISGRTDGLLENDRARLNQPKIFFTNSSVEHWGGGRAAPLITTTADGKKDLPLPANVRVYYFSGTQHSPGRFPSRTVTGQQPYNTTDYWWSLRALFVAMDQWVRQGVEPPASQYPKLADGTLVPVELVAFPAIPGVRSPKTIPAGRQDGKPIPFLVPQVDEDGNDKAGLRLPEVAVPVATYTGWNYRNPATGGSSLVVNLLGSAVPFPTTRAAREAAHDPRRSLEERYRSADEYLKLAREATDRLVQGRYLLAGDAPAILKRAEDQWRTSWPAASTRP